jgi:hypothetical protein
LNPLVYLSVLVKSFNDLGYVEGKNIHLIARQGTKAVRLAQP